MSAQKKPGRRKPRADDRLPFIWPPEEWPEEVRQAEIKAVQEGFAEFFASVAASFSPSPPPAEIIPFPDPKN